MRVVTTAALAISALARNRMRSMLTTLGIVIGVAAVVMMQSMGQGATAYVGEAISGLGTNMLIAQVGAPRSFGPPGLGAALFRPADLEVVRRQAWDVAAITPLNARMLRVVSGSTNRTVSVNAVAPEYFQIRQWGVSLGRLFSEDDNRRASQVCLIGETVREAFFLSGTDPIGQEIRVRDITCRVIGVMEAKGTAAFGADQDDIVFMPFMTFARRIAGSDRFGSFFAAAVSEERIDAAKEQMNSILRQRRHIQPGDDDDFAVRDPREIQALLQTVTGMLTLLLAGVAAISLVVGGIGIMNIMLVSVTERTREIGIRLAVGARSSDILAQFVVEAALLSGVGGTVGIVVGLAGAYGVAKLIHVPFIVPHLAIPVAFGVSVLVGIIFGVFPARKASRLNPLAALRFE
jgi:putative ABC transport system permease protein